MAGLSNNWEKYMLQYVFKQVNSATDFTPNSFPKSPTTLFVSLHISDPDDTAAIAIAAEVSSSGTGYLRAARAPDINPSTNTSWNAVATSGTAQVITNAADIVFAAATGSWGTIGFFGLWSVASAGTDDQYIISGTLSASLQPLSGNVVKFLGGAPGALSVSVD
jgi:hypothetical protein